MFKLMFSILGVISGIVFIYEGSVESAMSAQFCFIMAQLIKIEEKLDEQRN